MVNFKLFLFLFLVVAPVHSFIDDSHHIFLPDPIVGFSKVQNKIACVWSSCVPSGEKPTCGWVTSPMGSAHECVGKPGLVRYRCCGKESSG